MSYEGREVFICSHGHIQDFDTHDIDIKNAGDGIIIVTRTIRCPYCQEEMEYVGSVDDTNDTSWAKFYLKPIEKYAKIKDEYDLESNELTTVIKPARFKVIRAKKGEYYNFVTGEKIKNYIESPDDVDLK